MDALVVGEDFASVAFGHSFVFSHHFLHGALSHIIGGQIGQIVFVHLLSQIEQIGQSNFDIFSRIV